MAESSYRFCIMDDGSWPRGNCPVCKVTNTMMANSGKCMGCHTKEFEALEKARKSTLKVPPHLKNAAQTPEEMKEVFETVAELTQSRIIDAVEVSDDGDW